MMAGLPAIVIEGPRAVGKTATAMRRARTVHHLDDETTRVIAQADPERLIAGTPPILIDEWQRVPHVWDLVRRAVDDGAEPGRFLLTGSASGAGQTTHSGAGRIVTMRMRPLSLAERRIETPTVSLRELLEGDRPALAGRTRVRLADYAHEIVASGLPGLRHLPGRSLRAQLDGYLARLPERDFEELGRPVRRPATLRAWMTAYAAASSTTASYETIRDAATSGYAEKPARSTTLPYRDVLERLWLIDPVPAWLPRRAHLGRLSAPPKHQLADPAFAARLLGVTADALLKSSAPAPPIIRDGPLLGTLFESLVTLSVRVYAQAAEGTVGHLRTPRGDHEIDLILERGDGRVLAIEVKLTQNPDDSDLRHLRWLQGQLGDDLLDAVVVTTGPEAYRLQNGIAVVPAALLGP